MLPGLPAPSPGAGIRHYQPQVVHHPGSGTYSVPSRLIGKEVQVCTPTGWKCTTRATGWNGWNGCVARGKPTYRHVIAGAQARRLCPLPLPGAAISHHAPAGLGRVRQWRGDADVEYVRAPRPPWQPRWTARCRCCWRRVSPSAEVRDLKVPEAPWSGLGSRTENLRPPAHGQPGRHHDGHQRDAGPHRPVVRPIQAAHHGAQSVARFTAAGHGDALATFLEVLEQEAEDRRHRRINRLAALGQDLGNLRARPSPPGAAAATTSWPRAALWSAASTCWPSDCPAPARPTPGAPWATAWWKPDSPLRSGHRLVRNSSQARSGPAPPAAQAGQLRLPAPGRPGLPAPGRRGRRSSSPSSPNATLGITSNRRSHLCQPHGHRRGD